MEIFNLMYPQIIFLEQWEVNAVFPLMFSIYVAKITLFKSLF